MRKGFAARAALPLVLGLGLLASGCGGEDLSGTHELTYGGKAVEVPKKAEKILLDGTEYPIEDAMALDLKLAGISEGIKFSLFGGLNSYIANLEKVDTGSPEALQAFAPDAIIAAGGSEAEHIAELSAVAPVILSEADADWKENLRMLANLSGQKANGEKLIGQYEKDIKAFKKKWNPDGGKTALYVYLAKDRDDLTLIPSALPVLYEDLGFRFPVEEEAMGQVIMLDEAALSELDPDYIFMDGYWTEYAVDMREELEKLKNEPGWKEMSAVREGRLYGFEKPLADGTFTGTQSYSRITMLERLKEEMEK
ncbi:ABC transporter substrate-binding protein [Saccharibacillus alkalitolerans]|uniref:ABC transporter substrate-binding protein n=1 Tax=Saccharibacillus alkalitolerans TaxID=2705290 RepID=A0ABX0FCH2_9BACL|nr:ABC transporter substrate-binding protein [Saccharibacillus alkalitolerans]NGZ77283.1 ABC transporter substrate-binding protein [Saccharibacillus alkalitolerans]